MAGKGTELVTTQTNTLAEMGGSDDWYSKQKTWLIEKGVDAPTSMMIIQFCFEQEVSELTGKSYVGVLRTFVNWLEPYGGLQYNLQEVTVRAYKDWLKAEHATSTARLYLTIAKKFIEWLAARGYLAYNTAALVKGIKGGASTHQRDALTAGEVGAIFDKKAADIADAEKAVAAAEKAAANVPVGKDDYKLSLAANFQLRRANTAHVKALRDSAIVKLLACGLRTIEVVRLDVGDLERKCGRWILKIWGKGRTGKDDSVNLPTEVRTAILAYLKARGNVEVGEPLFSATSNRNRNQRLETQTISRLAKRAMIEAGVDTTDRKVCAHSYRHMNATTALECGVDADSASKNLRHKSIATIEVYRHDLAALKNNTNDTVFAEIAAERAKARRKGNTAS